MDVDGCTRNLKVEVKRDAKQTKPSLLASSLFLLLLAPITSEAISNPSTNINEVNREIVEESANDQATSAPSHSETLEQNLP